MPAQIDGLTAQIGALSTRIGELIAAIPGAQGVSADGTTGPHAGRGPDAAVLPAIGRLQEIPGISRHAARVIIAEIGLDMTRFPTAGHLISRARPCPRTIQSGASKRPGKTAKGNPYLKGVLGDAAAAKTTTFPGQRYRRLVKRRGKLKALVAVARTLLAIIRHPLADRAARSEDLGEDYYLNTIDTDRRARSHIRQLQAPGFTVTITPAAAKPPPATADARCHAPAEEFSCQPHRRSGAGSDLGDRLFPRPYSSKIHPFGAGSGPGLQKEMLESISVAVTHGKDSIPHMEYIDVLAGGLGLDRISDMTCNILKSYFIKYTQDVCRRHGIPMTNVLVHNAGWSADDYEWVSKRVELPINPAYARRRLPILLTPEVFIRDIPVASADGFVNYAGAAADLRRRFNLNLSRHVPRHLKAQMARANFSLIDQYFTMLEDQRHDAYPLEDDPRRRLNPGQTRTALASEYPAATIPTTQSEVPAFVADLVKNFAYCIEQKGIWRSLWYKNHGLGEATAQGLFYLTAINFCRQNDIMVTPESNAGRGPVDFVFGKNGKTARLLS